MSARFSSNQRNTGGHRPPLQARGVPPHRILCPRGTFPIIFRINDANRSGRRSIPDMKNLRLALRTLLRTPSTTAVAIVSLGLGIGATTSIFSIFNQMLLRPLPVTEPSRLVNLSAPGPKPGSQSCNDAGGCDAVFSYPMFRDLEKTQTVFTGIAAHRSFGANLAYRGQTMSGEGML